MVLHPLQAGVDEAGRGPLAGPVMAAAVILDPAHPIAGLNDSKKLSHTKRCALMKQIQAHALAWAVGEASVEEIDALNILQATLLAMTRALNGLNKQPDEALIDGNHCPQPSPVPCRAIIQGDQHIPAISAASIIAKVTRDERMLRLDQQYPVYGFAGHKGYGTRAHRDAILQYGPCPAHRTSFEPVKSILHHSPSQHATENLA